MWYELGRLSLLLLERDFEDLTDQVADETGKPVDWPLPGNEDMAVCVMDRGHGQEVFAMDELMDGQEFWLIFAQNYPLSQFSWGIGRKVKHKLRESRIRLRYELERM